jgi:hypothetical protein
MNANERNEYMLATGKFADLRLQILNRIIGQHSRKFLSNFLKRGMCIAEIGCGTGNMLGWLSQKVGSKGKVYAVDSRCVQPVLSDSVERKMLWLAMYESEYHFINHKLSSSSEIEFLSSKLKEISRDKKYTVTLPLFTQICGSTKSD